MAKELTIGEVIRKRAEESGQTEDEVLRGMGFRPISTNPVDLLVGMGLCSTRAHARRIVRQMAGKSGEEIAEILMERRER